MVLVSPNFLCLCDCDLGFFCFPVDQRTVSLFFFFLHVLFGGFWVSNIQISTRSGHRPVGRRWARRVLLILIDLFFLQGLGAA